MKKILVVLSVLVMFLSTTIFNLSGNKVEAATIGQKLTEPEAGWKRYDDSNPLINYEGYWIHGAGTGHIGYYNDTRSYTGVTNAINTNARVSFNFKGTKIRLIVDLMISNSSDSKISIDGGPAEPFSCYRETNQPMTLAYEKTNLPDTVHTVVITPGTTNQTAIMLDAIDIDSDGLLLDGKLIESLQLNKNSLELTVGSSESLVPSITPDDATNKKIKWTSSNPEIASVDDTGNVIGLKPGNVTITATTTDGSNLSATCEVTVTDTKVDANRGILKLTTTTGDLHEYDLSMDEIEKFINWIDGRDKGEGKPYYTFSLNVDVGNIEARTEYIMYDKIVSFVVDEYTSN